MHWDVASLFVVCEALPTQRKARQMAVSASSTDPLFHALFRPSPILTAALHCRSAEPSYYYFNKQCDSECTPSATLEEIDDPPRKLYTTVDCCTEDHCNYVNRPNGGSSKWSTGQAAGLLVWPLSALLYAAWGCF